ncbi:MAG: hypothetical protein RJB28_991 [Actinomycetota bacterium]
MPTSDNNFVTAIIVSHDGALWLPEVVTSLAKQRRHVDQLIAIDTGSQDSSVKLLKTLIQKFYQRLKALRNGFGSFMMIVHQQPML